MASAFPFGVYIDRESYGFEIYCNYYIQAYTDPETGEYFDETYWTATVFDAVTGANLGGNYGNGSDYGDAWMALWFDESGGVLQQRVEFSGYNWFSGDDFFAKVNVFNAGFSSTAQNLTGTTDTDIIAGGSGDDILNGGDGQDWLDGGDGADILSGGTGDDWLIGGGGIDTLVGGDGGDSYDQGEVPDIIVETEDGGDDQVFSGFSQTLPEFVETLILRGIAHIDGTGNAQDNRIDGNSGNNILSGLDGDDTLHGLAGKDTLNGGRGNDTLAGGEGEDVLRGGRGSDTYWIDSTEDRIIERGEDGGRDLALVAAITKFRMSGGLEDASRAAILADGTSEGITIIGNTLDNRIEGGTGDDTLNGGFGADRLFGMKGHDTLIGGFDGDVLRGGLGSDVLYGGVGSDVFVFGRLDGYDVVMDFQPGDKLRIDAGDAYDTFAEVKATASQIPAGTILSLGAGLTIQLMGVEQTALDAADFLFA